MSAVIRSPATPPGLLPFWRSPTVLGTILGVVSAIGYTATNICLRAVVHCDPIWVSCVKATPTAFVLAPWLLVGPPLSASRLPTGKALAALILAGLLGQLGGNVLFQWSLSVLGISLTVPLCLGSIILFSAVLGRCVLNEPVTPGTVISMSMLVAAIWALSLGAGAARDADRSSGSTATASGEPGLAATWVMPDPAGHNGNPGLLWAAICASCAAGAAYAILGVALRKSVMGRGSVVGSTWTIAIVGTVSLGVLSHWRLGWQGLLATSAADFQAMVAAGICNFVAFLSLVRALQLTTLIYVNALNASQVAMAALAGFYWFAEPASPALMLGVGLTVGGLLFMPAKPAN